MNYQLPSLLILILVCANGAPIIARKLLSSRFDTPVDGNLVLCDGQPLLGSSKTIRGVVAATLTTTAIFMILDMAVLTGLLFGLMAMLGDSLSSFVKRRARLKSGDSVPWLDQIPEALLPVLFVRASLKLDWLQVVVVVIGFALVNMVISPITYWLHIRRNPH